MRRDKSKKIEKSYLEERSCVDKVNLSCIWNPVYLKAEENSSDQ